VKRCHDLEGTPPATPLLAEAAKVSLKRQAFDKPAAAAAPRCICLHQIAS